MQAYLPDAVNVQFIDPPNETRTDWKERGANFCLYFLRAGGGKECTTPSQDAVKLVLVEKTDNIGLQALAGLMAYTLWLPLTLIGLALLYASESHSDAYARAHAVVLESMPAASHTGSNSSDQWVVVGADVNGRSMDFDTLSSDEPNASGALTVANPNAGSGGDVLVTIKNQLRTGGTSTVGIRMDEAQFKAASQIFQRSFEESASSPVIPRGIDHTSLVITNKRWDIVKAVFGNAHVGGVGFGLIGDYVGPTQITIHRIPNAQEPETDEERRLRDSTALTTVMRT